MAGQEQELRGRRALASLFLSPVANNPLAAPDATWHGLVIALPSCGAVRVRQCAKANRFSNRRGGGCGGRLASSPPPFRRCGVGMHRGGQRGAAEAVPVGCSRSGGARAAAGGGGHDTVGPGLAVRRASAQRMPRRRRCLRPPGSCTHTLGAARCVSPPSLQAVRCGRAHAAVNTHPLIHTVLCPPCPPPSLQAVRCGHAPGRTACDGRTVPQLAHACGRQQQQQQQQQEEEEYGVRHAPPLPNRWGLESVPECPAKHGYLMGARGGTAASAGGSSPPAGHALCMFMRRWRLVQPGGGWCSSGFGGGTHAPSAPDRALALAPDHCPCRTVDTEGRQQHGTDAAWGAGVGWAPWRGVVSLGCWLWSYGTGEAGGKARRHPEPCTSDLGSLLGGSVHWMQARGGQGRPARVVRVPDPA